LSNDVSPDRTGQPIRKEKDYERTIFAVLAVIITVIWAAPAHPSGRPALPGEVGIEVVSDGGTVFQAIPHKDFWTGSTHVTRRAKESTTGSS
jgi:hypothetical protein